MSGRADRPVGPGRKAAPRETLPLGADMPAAIDRLRRIAAEARDHLLLGDGPPHPDAELLDACGEALHMLVQARNLHDQARAVIDAADRRRSAKSRVDNGMSWIEDRKALSARPAWVEDWSALSDKATAIGATAAHRLRRVSHIPATTPAGIYSKALCVRASRTGAVNLAMSLAEDLVSNPALRAALWTVDAEHPKGRK